MKNIFGFIIDSSISTWYDKADFGRRRYRVTDRVFSKQLFWTTRSGLRPYGQPGPLPIMVTLVALLIELKAQIL